MGIQTTPLPMTQDDRHLLETWVRAGTTPQRVAFRAQICLLAAEGYSTGAIAQRMSTSRPTVLLWRKRFEELGPNGLVKDAPRGPSPRRLDDATTKAILDTTLNAVPPGAPHWTTRALAKVLGVSNATVARVWKAHGIRPRKRKSAKRAGEKPAVHERSYLLGAYLAYPLRAFVVAVEPVPSAVPTGTLPPDSPPEEGSWQYRLHREEYGCGPCSLAALGLLDGLSGPVPGPWGEVVDFVGFLRKIASENRNGRELHVLMDHGEVRPLPGIVPHRAKYGRFHVHAYPLDLSRANSVEKAVLRFTGAPLDTSESGALADLGAAIDGFVRVRNGQPRPFSWIRSQEPGPGTSDLCKVILETMRYVSSHVTNLMGLDHGRPKAVRPEEVIAMKWKERLESWFAAAAFAEAGEHDTALRMAETPIPAGEPVEILPSLSTVFAAAAFAEENCHEMALQIRAGMRPRISFLDRVGLTGVRIWSGIASLEPSFAETVGLAGARYRVVTVRL
ncbi:MAG: helix-turn-helix domain-containing protein [Thermodesulfobacteriota bacterium]